MTIATGDIAQTHNGLKGFMTRRLTTKSVSGATNETDIISDALDFLIGLDEIYFDFDTSKDLERLLSDIENIGELDEGGHLYNQAKTGLRKILMNKYYRTNKVRILMKRKKLRRHIRHTGDEKKKADLAKHNRAPDGKVKRKNHTKGGHINENYYDKIKNDYVDYGIFETAKKDGKRAQFADYLKPYIDRQKAFSKRDMQIEIIKCKSNKKAISEASVGPYWTSYMQDTWWRPGTKRVYINQDNVIIFCQDFTYEIGVKVSSGDIEKMKSKGYLPIKVNQKEKPEYKITYQDKGGE